MLYSNWLKCATVVALAVSFSSVAMGSTDAFPPCGSFVLQGGDFEYVTIDAGEPGQSIGDERLGERVLLDTDGNAVGVLRWVSRVVDVVDGQVHDEVALNQLVYSLPDRAIHATGQIRYEDILSRDTQPSDQNSIVVIGGSDAYVRSHGEIDATFTSDGLSRFDFRLHCDE
ncbi:MAG: hypothetical protein GY798_34815 [Hyphomicrobiales bacterium]|nr:hypothetical protein [Hyphomicrobiales bacterium]